MILYVLRHAIAKDRENWNKRDSDRPLTKEGQRKMRKAAKGLKQLKLNPDWILTSPYRRARHTAEIVADELNLGKKLKTLEELKSEANPQQLVHKLAREHKSKDSVLIVGHEPYLSRLISVLIGASSPLSLDLKKGGICKLEAESLNYGRCATLEWWIPPKLLRQLD